MRIFKDILIKHFWEKNQNVRNCQINKLIMTFLMMVFVRVTFLMTVLWVAGEESSGDLFLGTAVWRCECVSLLSGVPLVQPLETSPSLLIRAYRRACKWGPGMCYPHLTQTLFLSLLSLLCFRFHLSPGFLFTATLMKSKPNRNFAEKNWTITLGEFSSSNHVNFCTYNICANTRLLD